jgi:hypothetical protein
MTKTELEQADTKARLTQTTKGVVFKAAHVWMYASNGRQLQKSPPLIDSSPDTRFRTLPQRSFPGYRWESNLTTTESPWPRPLFFGDGKYQRSSLQGTSERRIQGLTERSRPPRGTPSSQRARPASYPNMLLPGYPGIDRETTDSNPVPLQ